MKYLSFALISSDNPLPIPAPIGLLEILIVATFIFHIIFVNFTISLTAGAVGLEITSMIKKNSLFDKMAQICSFHASIHKSIAVVLGVGPLLIVSVLYTQYFYSSTILIGKAWMSLLILLITAFLLLYIYKFTWDKYQTKKLLHISIGLLAMLILFFVPLIFIVNVTSMLYPDRWGEANGFFESLFYYPQIWQRYLHFMLASLATGGFYMFVYFAYQKRKQKRLEEHEQSLKLLGAKVGFWITIVQLVAGFILLFSFDTNIRMLYLGEDLLLTSLLIISIVLTVILCMLLYVAGYKDSASSFLASIIVFICVIGIMGWMRHELREAYLSPYLDEHPRTEERIESTSE
ncbi:cytochrome ubiquinol oxidase subunit I [Lysinibacillus sp. FSL K6-0232]|uniref:cytochrome ubiquinol oxidase subunit I n=1 Tax=Lysinibacillus sp. FSL K6-0232 TaxID=2921425 RepID=UPI0030F65B5D